MSSAPGFGIGRARARTFVSFAAAVLVVGLVVPTGASALTLQVGDLAYLPSTSGQLRAGRASGTDAGWLAQSASAPRWSPDGRHVAYIAPHEYFDGVNVVDAATGSTVDLGDEAGWVDALAWDSAGSKVYYRVDMAGSTTVPEFWRSCSPVSNGSAYSQELPEDFFFVWSMSGMTGGRLVAAVHEYDFAERTDGGYYRAYKPWRLQVMTEAGTVLRTAPITSSLGFTWIADPKASPDGSKVVFSASDSSNYSSLWMWDLKADTVKPLFRKTFEYNEYPCFTPDGAAVVWTRRYAGRSELWKMWADGTAAYRLMSDVRGADVRPGNYPLPKASVRYTNPVAYDLKSLKTTRFYCASDVDSPWAELTVACPTGTKTLFKGSLGPRNKTFYFPLWDGMDRYGKRMPSATYTWTLRLTKNGVTSTTTGKISVSRICFTISGTSANGATRHQSAYMVPGNANCYLQASAAAAGDSVKVALHGPNAYRVSLGSFGLPGPPSYLNKTLYVSGSSALKSRGLHEWDMTGTRNVTYRMTVIQ